MYANYFIFLSLFRVNLAKIFTDGKAKYSPTLSDAKVCIYQKILNITLHQLIPCPRYWFNKTNQHTENRSDIIMTCSFATRNIINFFRIFNISMRLGLLYLTIFDMFDLTFIRAAPVAEDTARLFEELCRWSHLWHQVPWYWFDGNMGHGQFL